MTSLSKTLFGAGVAAGVAAFSVVNASASDCMHRHGLLAHAFEAYDYPPDARVIVHPDDWRWGAERALSLGVSMKAAAIGTATAGWNGNRAVFEEQVLDFVAGPRLLLTPRGLALRFEGRVCRGRI